MSRILGSLTKAVLRDLRRMTPKELSETEEAILAGESSRVEYARLLPHELLSKEAWRQLSVFSSDGLKRHFEARLELHNYRLGERLHALIEFASGYPELSLEVTEYGRAYRERFARSYQELYTPESTELT